MSVVMMTNGLIYVMFHYICPLRSTELTQVTKLCKCFQDLSVLG